MPRSRMFSKDIPPACRYCKYGFLTRDKESVLCEKRGITKPHDQCRKYVYAPLKRIPKRPPAMPDFSLDDFLL